MPGIGLKLIRMLLVDLMKGTLFATLTQMPVKPGVTVIIKEK